MKNTTFVRLVGLFALIFVGILVGGLLQGVFLYATGHSSSVFQGGGMDQMGTGPLKIVLAIGHVFTFLLPPFLFAVAHSRTEHRGRIKGALRYFRLDPSFHLSVYAWSVLLLLAALPWVQYLQQFNAQIDLPAWAQFMEQDAQHFIRQLLTMDSPGSFISTFIIVAVLPAVGEELLFRGSLQNEFERIGPPHLAVWISAFLFSAFHLQFAGFLPRLGLGLLLGYIYLWSRSLWVPIFLHFLFNGIQVVIVYIMDSDVLSAEPTPSTTTSTWALVLSSFFVFWAGRQLIRWGTEEDQYE